MVRHPRVGGDPCQTLLYTHQMDPRLRGDDVGQVVFPSVE